MTQADPNNEAMKQAFKDALTETLHEQRELLHEVFAEVLEDFTFSEAIREGRQTERVDRDEVFGDEENYPQLLRTARGMWKDRDDLPDFQTLRREFDEHDMPAEQ